MTRYYVTMTWDDWPEGGSYGTVVEADSFDEAELLCRKEMAALRSKDDDGYNPEDWKDEADEEPVDPATVDGSPEWYLATFWDEWEVVDCFDLDEFIAMHSKKEKAHNGS